MKATPPAARCVETPEQVDACSDQALWRRYLESLDRADAERPLSSST